VFWNFQHTTSRDFPQMTSEKLVHIKLGPQHAGFFFCELLEETGYFGERLISLVILPSLVPFSRKLRWRNPM